MPVPTQAEERQNSLACAEGHCALLVRTLARAFGGDAEKVRRVAEAMVADYVAGIANMPSAADQ